jgi:hypothetical protein
MLKLTRIQPKQNKQSQGLNKAANQWTKESQVGRMRCGSNGWRGYPGRNTRPSRELKLPRCTRPTDRLRLWHRMIGYQLTITSGRSTWIASLFNTDVTIFLCVDDAASCVFGSRP